MANQFHYYRQTSDWRILWGGYDAVYRYGGHVRPEFDDDEGTFAMLSQHLHDAFPQLEGVRFYRWGGAIDTCSRFSVFFGTAHGGRVAYRDGARCRLDALRRASAWTCSTAARPRRPGCSTSARSPCRSRRSRCARG